MLLDIRVEPRESAVIHHHRTPPNSQALPAIMANPLVGLSGAVTTARTSLATENRCPPGKVQHLFHSLSHVAAMPSAYLEATEAAAVVRDAFRCIALAMCATREIDAEFSPIATQFINVLTDRHHAPLWVAHGPRASSSSSIASPLRDVAVCLFGDDAVKDIIVDGDGHDVRTGTMLEALVGPLPPLNAAIFCERVLGLIAIAVEQGRVDMSVHVAQFIDVLLTVRGLEPVHLVRPRGMSDGVAIAHLVARRVEAILDIAVLPPQPQLNYFVKVAQLCTSALQDLLLTPIHPAPGAPALQAEGLQQIHAMRRAVAAEGLARLIVPVRLLIRRHLDTTTASCRLARLEHELPEASGLTSNSSSNSSQQEATLVTCKFVLALFNLLGMLALIAVPAQPTSAKWANAKPAIHFDPALATAQNTEELIAALQLKSLLETTALQQQTVHTGTNPQHSPANTKPSVPNVPPSHELMNTTATAKTRITVGPAPCSAQDALHDFYLIGRDETVCRVPPGKKYRAPHCGPGGLRQLLLPLINMIMSSSSLALRLQDSTTCMLLLCAITSGCGILAVTLTGVLRIQQDANASQAAKPRLPSTTVTTPASALPVTQLYRESMLRVVAAAFTRYLAASCYHPGSFDDGRDSGSGGVNNATVDLLRLMWADVVRGPLLAGPALLEFPLFASAIARTLLPPSRWGLQNLVAVIRYLCEVDKRVSFATALLPVMQQKVAWQLAMLPATISGGSSLWPHACRAVTNGCDQWNAVDAEAAIDYVGDCAVATTRRAENDDDDARPLPAVFVALSTNDEWDCPTGHSKVLRKEHAYVIAMLYDIGRVFRNGGERMTTYCGGLLSSDDVSLNAIRACPVLAPLVTAMLTRELPRYHSEDTCIQLASELAAALIKSQVVMAPETKKGGTNIINHQFGELLRAASAMRPAMLVVWCTSALQAISTCEVADAASPSAFVLRPLSSDPSSTVKRFVGACGMTIAHEFAIALARTIVTVRDDLVTLRFVWWTAALLSSTTVTTDEIDTTSRRLIIVEFLQRSIVALAKLRKDETYPHPTFLPLLDVLLRTVAKSAVFERRFTSANQAPVMMNTHTTAAGQKKKQAQGKRLNEASALPAVSLTTPRQWYLLFFVLHWCAEDPSLNSAIERLLDRIRSDESNVVDDGGETSANAFSLCRLMYNGEGKRSSKSQPATGYNDDDEVVFGWVAKKDEEHNEKASTAAEAAREAADEAARTEAEAALAIAARNEMKLAQQRAAAEQAKRMKAEQEAFARDELIRKNKEAAEEARLAREAKAIAAAATKDHERAALQEAAKQRDEAVRIQRIIGEWKSMAHQLGIPNSVVATKFVDAARVDKGYATTWSFDNVLEFIVTGDPTTPWTADDINNRIAAMQAVSFTDEHSTNAAADDDDFWGSLQRPSRNASQKHGAAHTEALNTAREAVTVEAALRCMHARVAFVFDAFGFPSDDITKRRPHPALDSARHGSPTEGAVWFATAVESLDESVRRRGAAAAAAIVGDAGLASSTMEDKDADAHDDNDDVYRSLTHGELVKELMEHFAVPVGYVRRCSTTAALALCPHESHGQCSVLLDFLHNKGLIYYARNTGVVFLTPLGHRWHLPYAFTAAGSISVSCSGDPSFSYQRKEAIAAWEAKMAYERRMMNEIRTRRREERLRARERAKAAKLAAAAAAEALAAAAQGATPVIGNQVTPSLIENNTTVSRIHSSSASSSSSTDDNSDDDGPPVPHHDDQNEGDLQSAQSGATTREDLWETMGIEAVVAAMARRREEEKREARRQERQLLKNAKPRRRNRVPPQPTSLELKRADVEVEAATQHDVRRRRLNVNAAAAAAAAQSDVEASGALACVPAVDPARVRELKTKASLRRSAGADGMTMRLIIAVWGPRLVVAILMVGASYLLIMEIIDGRGLRR